MLWGDPMLLLESQLYKSPIIQQFVHDEPYNHRVHTKFIKTIAYSPSKTPPNFSPDRKHHASIQYFIYVIPTIICHQFHHNSASRNSAASSAINPHSSHLIRSRHVASARIDPADLLLLSYRTRRQLGKNELVRKQ